MLIQTSRLINLPVASSETESLIAILKYPLIDPQDGQLIAWLVKTPGFFQNQKILSSNDIVEYNKDAVIIASPENLVAPEEIVRARPILKNNIKIIGAIARVESGGKIGKVYDLLLNTELGKIVKLHIRDWINDRIIPADKIVKIDKSGIIIQDDAITMPSGAEAIA